MVSLLLDQTQANDKQTGNEPCVRCALHTHIRTQIAIIETEQKKKKLTGK